MRSLAFLLPLLFLACQNTKTQDFDLVITNLNLIDVINKKLVPNTNVYIKSGKISKIDRGKIEFNSGEKVDGTDKFLIPGLFDCHTHTSNYLRDFPRFMQFGTTSVFVLGGNGCTNEYFEAMRNMGNQDTIPAPRVFHTSQHFIKEGGHPVRTYPMGDWRNGKTVFYIEDTLQIEKLVKEVSKYPIQGIKLTIEDGPMPPPVSRLEQGLINKVKKEATKNGTKVFVHVSDNIELGMALEAGIENIVHYTGVDLDFEKDTLLLKKIDSLNISWATTLMLDKSFIYALHPEWIENSWIGKVYSQEEIGDYKSERAIERAQEGLNVWKYEFGFENPDLEQIVAFQVQDIQNLYKRGVNMVLGTDTGNTFILPGHSLHEEMQLLELGGMQPMDILVMGTINAAKMMDSEHSLGSIEEGKLADMVLLNKNPLASIKNTLAIHSVYKNGKLQKSIKQL